MASLIKIADIHGIKEMLQNFYKALRNFFASKENMDVVSIALNDLNMRKIEASYLPTSLPANGGNADTSDYAKYLRGRSPNGNYYEPESVNCNIIAEWNTKSDNRWYLKSDLSQCRVGYADNAENADKVTWSGIENKPADTIGDAKLVIQVNGTKIIPTGGDFTANKSGDVSIYNIPIGNGRLILKNGNDIISDNFTANKDSDTTIDLKKSFATRPEINTLGDRMNKVDTSIIELNTSIRVDNPFDDSGEDDEDTIESNEDVLEYKIGDMSLRFYDITTYIDLPVHWVNVAKICDISEVGNSISSLYNIRITIDITGTTIASTVGISSDTFKQFYIRGANMKNNICGFDLRGNGTTNTATAIKSGKYLLLNCQLKLHGDKSDIGSFIMEKAKNWNFNAYLCLRQTI